MKKVLLLIMALVAISAARAESDFHATPSGSSSIVYYRYLTNTSSSRTVAVTCPGNAASPYGSNTKPSGSIIVPSTVQYGGFTYNVTAVDPSAFYQCTGLTAVQIPNSVTSIGSSAFCGCSNLVSVVLPSGLTTINETTFSGCSSLQNVTIPSNVTNIKTWAFKNCSSLQSIAIPSSVTTLGTAVFYGCSTLATVDFNATNCTSSNTTGSDSWFFACNALATVNIGSNVTKIPAYAFNGCTHITSLTIPGSVTSLGRSAFKGCSALATVNFNATNCTAMGEQNFPVFENCTTLTTINIGEGVTRIPAYAFKKCNQISSITIPAGITRIDKNAFTECTSLTTVNFNPTACQNLGSSDTYLFNGCTSFTTLNIGEGVTRIPEYSFGDATALTTVNIPNTVTYIGQSAFKGDVSLETIVIPNSVTAMMISAFAGCTSLRSVQLSTGCTGLAGNVFYGCTQLESVIIPSTVTSVGSYAFRNCTNLTIFDLTNTNWTNLGCNVKRIVKCSNHGSGNNAIHKINSSYGIENGSTNSIETEIPLSLIPDNFIFSNDGGNTWQAKNIVLTDDTSRFNAPVPFTAVNATYTRNFTNTNRSTLYLPFSATTPANFEVYEYTGFDGSTLSFSPASSSTIEACHPYLVGYGLAKTTCTITQQNAVFPRTAADTGAITQGDQAHGTMTFHGVTARTTMASGNYGYSNGFFVQSGGSAHVNPFRCYFTYTAGTNSGAPTTIDIDITDDGNVAIEVAEPEQQHSARYSTDVYDMMGRMVRRNAETLQGLPRGIYIWRGKKVMVY